MTVSLSVPHPIMRVGPVGSDGPLASITVGALLAPQSSLVSYSIIALSYSVSCSRVRLCIPQSRCFTRDECRLNVLTHPSSGHVKNRELLTVDMDMASLSKLSSVCRWMLAAGSSGTYWYEARTGLQVDGGPDLHRHQLSFFWSIELCPRY